MSEVNMGYGPGARHADHELDEEQCWSLLGSSGIGRLGFVHEGRVAVYPVGYIVSQGAVFVRTSREGTIARSLPSQGAALETDSLQPAVKAGWSVLVNGTAEAVEDEAELTRLFGLAAEEPWAGGVRDLFVRIRPERLSGRQVYLAP
ncbi:pyridoxamine 5'-phosphate oxidase family protein [Sinomonas halotolerans]|uniref:Pyridoxamine 5'-phosphate oxidase family protein n=1 Tax=Sinomonas halotolerans TaxID=1644133 RepID=A0ABU9WY69_9MICC